MQSHEKKLNHLYLVLSVFFIGNALLAELIGVKIFSLNKILGMDPGDSAGSWLAGLNLNMSLGILMWPFVFILSDIINEYFGRKGVRKISLLGALIIAYSSVFLYVGAGLPPADFWMDLNRVDRAGQPFTIDYAFNVLFKQSIGIIIGSITAFLVSQLIDAYTFHFLRKITGHKKLWLRATGSTVVSQLIDSFLILTIAFYLLGNWSMMQVLQVGVIQYLYKIFMAVVLTPLIYLIHYVIDTYLGKKESYQIIDQIDKNW